MMVASAAVTTPDALLAALSQSSVEVAAAVTMSSTIVVDNGADVSIVGVTSDAAIQGGRKTQLFRVTDGSLVVANIGLYEGYVVCPGGVGCVDTTGAVAYVEARLALINCTVANGRASPSGGAVSVRSGGFVEIRNCVFKSNVGEQRGGALYGRGGTIVAYDSIFEANLAGISGTTGSGAVLSARDGGSFYARNCSFRSNTARNVRLVLCHALTAPQRGGAVDIEGANVVVTIEDSDVMGNVANKVRDFGHSRRFSLVAHSSAAHSTSRRAQS